MINSFLPVSFENNYLEPFEDRIDILLRELELAAKWQRPSVLWAIYSSEYVRADADSALESRLQSLGQSAYHIKIENQKSADVSLQIAELANMDNMVFFVDGLRWGAEQDEHFAYQTLNNRREYFIDNQVRIVFWLTEKEAIDLAHYAPEYWSLRHRVIEFVDSPKPDQISTNILESTWQGTGEFTDSIDDLDAKIALRTALLADLPAGKESTSARANLLLTLGMLHWRRGDYDRATQFLNNALDQAAGLEDNYFEALCFNAIALVQTKLGRIEEAIQAYQNAIGLAPKQISAWNNLGHLYRKIGNHEEALAAFQKAVEQNGTDAVAWNGLGDVYHDTGQNQEAILAYLKAIEFSPEYAPSWCGLGNSHLSEGRLEDALRAHQKAIEIDRCTVKSWLGLGDICRMQGNEESASMAYRTALEQDPKNALAWNELGNLYYRAGAYEEAMRSYLKCIEFNQGRFLTYSNLASIYVLKGLHTEAIPLLEKGLELSHDITETAGLWNRLGDAYRQLEDYDNAVVAYRKAEFLKPETVSSETRSPTPISDAQTTSSEDIPDQPISHLKFDPSEEEPLLPESSEPDIVDTPGDSFVPDDEGNDSTKPGDDFVEWLFGLSSKPQEAALMEMTESTSSSPVELEKMDAATESETEDEDQTCKSNQLILPVEEDPCNSSEPSPAFSDIQILSDLPFERTASENTPDPSLAPTSNLEEADPSIVKNDQHNPGYEETAAIYESRSQANIAEHDGSTQTQVTINEKNAQIWNELGNIYYNTGAFDEALHAFEMAIELDPVYGWSYNNLASIHIHNKRYAEAIPLYEKGLQLLDEQKDKAVLWNRMGDAYRRLNKQEQAIMAYRKAMELDPDNVSLLTRARFSLLGNL